MSGISVVCAKKVVALGILSGRAAVADRDPAIQRHRAHADEHLLGTSARGRFDIRAAPTDAVDAGFGGIMPVAVAASLPALEHSWGLACLSCGREVRGAHGTKK